jgi:hypothetical protein
VSIFGAVVTREKDSQSRARRPLLFRQYHNLWNKIERRQEQPFGKCQHRGQVQKRNDH